MPFVANPKPTTFRCSWKQVEVMRHVLEAADKGRFLWLRELNNLISWGPIASASITTIIRHLEAHGFVKRYYSFEPEIDINKMLPGTARQDQIRGMKMWIVPTSFAYTFFRPGRR